MLGGADVRAVLQYIGRQAGGQAGQQAGIQLIAQQQLRGNGGTHQQTERVVVFGYLSGIERQLHPGLLDQAARLAHIQCRGDATRVAGLDHLQTFLVAVQRGLGQFQQGMVGIPGQPGTGHITDQCQLHGILHLLCGQIAFQRGTFQAANPTEQVEFPAGTQGQAVLAVDAGLTGG